jgi:hypothetical protein
MKTTLKIGISILALAALCSAHPGHGNQAYGIYWKHPGQAHQGSADNQIWRYAFVSIYSWTGSR